MNVVIVGASGYVGSALYQQLSANDNVTGTYCFSPVAGLLHYNMLTDDPASLPIEWSKTDSVVLAAGRTRIEECARDVERTRRLNVTAVSKFCEFAAERKLHVTFLSTDYVYDGIPDPSGKPRLHREDEQLAPTTQHGMQRMDAERCLQSQLSDCLIARLTMNVSVSGQVRFPFTSWVEPLLRGESLRLANDWVHCITWVNDTVRALEVALRNRARGVYNVSAPEFCSRYEWGLKTCHAIGADPALIVPCSVEDLGFSEPRPRDLSLNTNKFQNAFQFEFTDPEKLMRVLSEIYGS